MPCFKGLAVSIHTPDGPLAEHSIQRQSKHSRITSYIPVPPAKIPPSSTTNKPVQSTFAISITLLTPGLQVPYSQPKATPDEPWPKPKTVGLTGEAGRGVSGIGPYLPLTASPNETIAAYIYFDGRVKEEVATLLRRGEETWVNSRWVSVPDVEGGGLAEREFLFREVGLERWLNGLDLDGKDAAAKIARRKERLEKRRRKKKESKSGDIAVGDMDVEPGESRDASGSKDVLRYGSDARSPVEKLSDEDDMLFSDSDSESDPPEPEAAGQIKVALFRVLASGEIKRGEYSPQFSAHDDDEDKGKNGHAGGAGGRSEEADIDHTTSFAEPKTLDPKSISTQTVTGIDGPDKPYAVFTFLYRGEKQLQKMGILPTPQSEEKPARSSAKRRSVQTDFSKLGPLKAGGTVGFSTFRDKNSVSPSRRKPGKGKSSNGDSDDDEEDEEKASEMGDIPEDAKGDNKDLLSPEDAQRQGELADGVRKIKLKRAHSAEPPGDRKSPAGNSSLGGHTPPSQDNVGSTPPATQGSNANSPKLQPAEVGIVGSPLKKQRASLSGADDQLPRSRLGQGFPPGIGDVLGNIEKAENKGKKPGEDEEL
ncbi:MAG: hypothetical protein M4579_000580 [Chaenotheca gracillima]|nr:MAG: hypothetical protein M4579_000580 [Chaenotheca gracillima]